MRKRTQLFVQFFAVDILAVLLIELVFRLSRFPGLHGDEARVGLQALEFMQNGLVSVHGMNKYTGALFPDLVALMFSTTGLSIFSLRVLGALSNWAAVAIAMAPFWKQGITPLYLAVLFASSLLFLFYSRVAWEVCALDNLAVSSIVFALSRILSPEHSRFRYVMLFFLAFAIGSWNHFIFLAAALSFAMAAFFIALRDQNDQGAKLFILSALNLLVLAIICSVKPLIADGDFLTHVLPALSGGIATVLAASCFWSLSNERASLWFLNLIAAKPSASRVSRLMLFGFIVVALTFELRGHLTAFFGVLSGVVMLERVVSYAPQPVEVTIGFLWAAVLIGIFLFFWIREALTRSVEQSDILRSAILLWPAAFLAISQFVAHGTSPRYYLIPNFIILVALALVLDEVRSLWKSIVTVVLFFGLFQAQFFFWREATNNESR